MSRPVVLGFLSGVVLVAILGAHPLRMCRALGPPVLLGLSRHLVDDDGGRGLRGGSGPDPRSARDPARAARITRRVRASTLLMLGQLVIAGLDVGRFHWSDTRAPGRAGGGAGGDGRRDGGPDLGGGGQSLLLLGDPHPDRTRTPRDHQRPLSLRAAPRLCGLSVLVRRRRAGAGVVAGGPDRTPPGRPDPAAHRPRRIASSTNNSRATPTTPGRSATADPRACGSLPAPSPTKSTSSRGSIRC